MKIKNIIIFLLADFLLVIYGGVSWYFSNQLTFFTARTLEQEIPKYEINSYEKVGLQKPEDIQIQVDDVTLKGWYFKGDKQCGIIFHHGYGGSRIGVIKYIPLFKEYNCHMILYDARHHGDSTRKFATFGFYEKQDLSKVVDFLKEKTKLNDENILLMGESMGAATILQFAGYTKRKFKMILAESPYKDLYSIVKKRSRELYGRAALIFLPGAFFFSEKRADFDIDDVSPLKYAPNIVTPVLIIHSEKDEYTPHEHSVEIFKALTVPEKELILTDWGSAHAKSIDDNFEKFNFYVKEFIKKYKITF